MSREFGKEIIKRALEEQANRRHIPVKEEVEGLQTILQYKVEVQIPQVENVLQAKWKREREEALKWIEDSKTIPDETPDLLGKLHAAMNQRNAAARWKIFDADFNYERKKRRTGGWGRHGNLTRKRYFETSTSQRKKAYEKLVNKPIPKAEDSGTKSKQPHPKPLFPENEDTTP